LSSNLLKPAYNWARLLMNETHPLSTLLVLSLLYLFGALSKNYQFDFSENKLKRPSDRFQMA
jgi:hypothetical protein